MTPKQTQRDVLAEDLVKLRAHCAAVRWMLSYSQSEPTKRDRDLMDRLFTDLLTVEMTIGRF
jgi:hypothetical protein